MADEKPSGNEAGPGDAAPPSSSTFDLAAEVAAFRAQSLPAAGRATRTLASLPGLRILLVAMRQGTRWQEHTAPGRITVQTLDGHVRMTVRGEVLDLPAGRLAVLGTRIPHDVDALADSVFLLTVDRDEP